MLIDTLTLPQLWHEVGFTPNDNQRRAIEHIDGPLYLPAGPGSGKTRVLLWRTVNLVVFHDVDPESVYLATFTEKAALQLREGLRTLLGVVTAHTGQPYDLSKMYVGTVHALCQRIITDRRFYPDRQRGTVPTLMDELGQYFHLYKKRLWNDLLAAGGFSGDYTIAHAQINSLFGSSSTSRHVAVSNVISLFNRFSEECIDPPTAVLRVTDPIMRSLLRMYDRYRTDLGARYTDFSLVQQRALQILDGIPTADRIFQHVIVDEYQDTNTIQERLFFRMAGGHKNLCVVGDDDQALYRFRGATVENFVEFPERCTQQLGVAPRPIPLATNYRSRERIVSFYTDFMGRASWRKPAGGSYRVENKNIHAHSVDTQPSVIASAAAAPLTVCAEIAQFVRRLLDEGKVENANQIAFLFPSFKYQGVVATQVQRMKDALEAEGLLVYAPRAGRFLEVEESTAMFGLFLHLFGKPNRGTYGGNDYTQFHDWLDAAYERGRELLRADRQLSQYMQERKAEIDQVLADYTILTQLATRNGWDLAAPYDIATMKRVLVGAAGLSERARRSLSSARFEEIVYARQRAKDPFKLSYVINRATALDHNVLDLFYRFCGFEHFRHMFDLAERGEDEGPICNLGLVSQYLARYMDEYSSIITADSLRDDRFKRLFFASYLFALFRRGEAEYEDADDPFPKGRIPFLTIHQAKGLEFPVVVLANPRKQDRGPQPVETLVQPLIDRVSEPLDRMSEFDIMRMFYVALSRAKNLLVLAHFKSQGNYISEPFKTMLDGRFPRIADYNIATLPSTPLEVNDTPRNYSYTADYLLYQKCPRQYMVFRRYGFVPSRSQTMMFGSLVHRTIEDLHQYLIAQRSAQ